MLTVQSGVAGGTELAPNFSSELPRRARKPRRARSVGSRMNGDMRRQTPLGHSSASKPLLLCCSQRALIRMHSATMMATPVRSPLRKSRECDSSAICEFLSELYLLLYNGIPTSFGRKSIDLLWQTFYEKYQFVHKLKSS